MDEDGGDEALGCAEDSCKGDSEEGEGGKSRGVKVDSADQTVSARLADHAVAPLLDLEIGAPLLAVTRVVRDKARRPVQLLRGLYRPDRYEYQMHLSRAGRDEARIWVSRD